MSDDWNDVLSFLRGVTLSPYSVIDVIRLLTYCQTCHYVHAKLSDSGFNSWGRGGSEVSFQDVAFHL